MRASPLPFLIHRRVDCGADVLDRIDLPAEDKAETEVADFAEAHAAYGGVISVQHKSRSGDTLRALARRAIVRTVGLRTPHSRLLM